LTLSTLKKTLIGLLLGLACAAVALGAGRLPFVRTIELKTYDWRMRATADPSAARDDIVLVTIDADSLRALEPRVGRWPWPRLVHAPVIDFLARGGARVVAYDVLFTEHDRRRFDVEGEEWTGAESDAELARATADAGMVVHVGDAADEATDPENADRLAARALPGLRYRLDHSIEERRVFVPPMPDLAGASRAVGHNFVVLDPDGPLRRYVPFIRTGDAWLPSLGAAAAALALGLEASDVRVDEGGVWFGSRLVPLVRAEVPSFYGERQTSRRALIRYMGGVMQDGSTTYRRYSFAKLFNAAIQLSNGRRPDVDPQEFAGRIVVVGTTAPALFDLFTVPFPGKMPGAQVHAAFIDDVLSGRSLRPAAPGPSIGVTLAAGAGLALAGVLLGPWAAIGLALAGSAGLSWALALAFARGVWYPLVEPLGAIALATLSGVTYHYVVEGREKRRVKRLFSRYVSRDIYEQLLKDPARARLGGQRRHMTVLFSDIRGFTSVSERGEPEAIVAQLNEYFSRMVPLVLAHRGTLDKFVGDMIMALFGAPLDDDAHAEHALQASVAMVRELERLNQEWSAGGRAALDIGIGINTGDMVAGNLGSETIMSYTVIGDHVNLAARLESLNKDFNSRIIISDATRRQLRGEYDIRPLGSVTVKGKTQSVEIFEVLVPAETAMGRTPAA
jgi:adenylate cyclase